MFRIQNLVMTGVNLLDAKNRVAASSRSVFSTVIITMLLGLPILFEYINLGFNLKSHENDL
jgi:hypothetical protein